MCTGWAMKLMIKLECLDRYIAYAVCLDIWDSAFGLFGTNQTFKKYKNGKRLGNRLRTTISLLLD